MYHLKNVCFSSLREARTITGNRTLQSHFVHHSWGFALRRTIYWYLHYTIQRPLGFAIKKIHCLSHHWLTGQIEGEKKKHITSLLASWLQSVFLVLFEICNIAVFLYRNLCLLSLSTEIRVV